jgi:hypothetical protein
MTNKNLNSADELNIDTFFRENPAEDTVADESEEVKPDTSENAPDENAVGSSKERADEDLEDDIDLEDEEENEEEEDDEEEDDEESDKEKNLKRKKKKKDVSKGIDALKKQADNAERQRKQMQSERDAFKARAEKADSKIDTLAEKVEQLTKLTDKLTERAEQQKGTPEYFTGDDDALATEDQLKKFRQEILDTLKEKNTTPEDERLVEEKLQKIVNDRLGKETETQVTEQAKIGTDLEAQKFWAESQPDVEEVGSYFNENRAALEPELASIPSIDGRYIAVRVKKLEEVLKSTKKSLRKAKQKLKRMEKGELPETASGKRSRPTENKQAIDPIDKFFST